MEQRQKTCLELNMVSGSLAIGTHARSKAVKKLRHMLLMSKSNFRHNGCKAITAMATLSAQAWQAQAACLITGLVLPCSNQCTGASYWRLVFLILVCQDNRSGASSSCWWHTCHRLHCNTKSLPWLADRHTACISKPFQSKNNSFLTGAYRHVIHQSQPLQSLNIALH